MKRLLALLLLSAGAAFAAEQATLSADTVMRTADSLVILKAGTTVQVLKQNEKAVTVKVGNQTGRIPWSALASAVSDSALLSVSPKPVEAAAAKTDSAPAAAPTASPSAPPHKAQTMYGKAVEKAAAATDSHGKAVVQPTDEILGGK